MKTDRSRLMGSKEPPGYFYEAFSYIRFLFFRGNNYSIKTNRARPPIASGRSGCRLRRIDVIAYKRNYEFTCYLQSFRKALTLFVMMRNISISVVPRITILHNRFHIHSRFAVRSILMMMSYTVMETSTSIYE